jgi:hypothetical protein
LKLSEPFFRFLHIAQKTGLSFVRFIQKGAYIADIDAQTGAKQGVLPQNPPTFYFLNFLFKK